MEKVTNDPACKLDQNANFERPEKLQSDFDIPFLSKDTISWNKQLPAIEKAEDVSAESNYTLPTTPKPIQKMQVPVKESPNKVGPKQNKEAEKPKAILLPKKSY